MKENIQLFAKISGKTMLAWLRIIILGGMLFIVCFIVAIMLFSDNTGPGFSGAGHAGGLGAIIGLFLLFATEFWTATLLFGSIGCLIFYVAFANKYALHTTLNAVWQSKLSGVIMEKATYYLSALSNKQPDWMKKAGAAAGVKMQLLQAMKDDTSISSIQRRVLGYGFKKAALNDIDFSNNNVTAQSVILSKLEAKLNDAVQPTMKPFWIVAGLQLLVMILAVIYNHH